LGPRGEYSNALRRRLSLSGERRNQEDGGESGCQDGVSVDPGSTSAHRSSRHAMTAVCFNGRHYVPPTVVLRKCPALLCGERKGVERPALARSLGRCQLMPAGSNGLLDAAVITERAQVA
jgi:hypothetical protein